MRLCINISYTSFCKSLANVKETGFGCYKARAGSLPAYCSNPSGPKRRIARMRINRVLGYNIQVGVPSKTIVENLTDLYAIFILENLWHRDHARPFNQSSSNSWFAVCRSSGRHCIIFRTNLRKACLLLPSRFSSDSSKPVCFGTGISVRHWPIELADSINECRKIVTIFIEKLGSPLPFLQEFGRRRSHQSDHFGKVSTSQIFVLHWIPAGKHVLVFKQVPDLIIPSVSSIIAAIILGTY